MKIDLEAIERIARAAQERAPGEWEYDGKDERIMRKGYHVLDPAVVSGGSVGYQNAPMSVYEEVAEHIAQCSPDVVLAMVRVVKAAVRAAADIRSDTPDGGASQYELLQAVDALDGGE